jgi:hypothetical protein
VAAEIIVSLVSAQAGLYLEGAILPVSSGSRRLLRNDWRNIPTSAENQKSIYLEQVAREETTDVARNVLISMRLYLSEPG